MRQTIEKRLGDLEQRLAPRDVLTIFRTFVAASESGPVDLEPVAIRHRSGWRLDRLPGETAEELRARAASLAPKPDAGCALLLLDVLPEEDCQ